MLDGLLGPVSYFSANSLGLSVVVLVEFGLEGGQLLGAD